MIKLLSFADNELEEYLDRIEQSFLVNKVEEGLKVPFLISTAGKEFNEKVKVLVKPRLVTNYSTLCGSQEIVNGSFQSCKEYTP